VRPIRIPAAVKIERPTAVLVPLGERAKERRSDCLRISAVAE